MYELKQDSLKKMIEETFEGMQKPPEETTDKMRKYLCAVVMAEPEKRKRLDKVISYMIDKYDRKGYYMELFKRAYNIYEQMYFNGGVDTYLQPSGA